MARVVPTGLVPLREQSIIVEDAANESGSAIDTFSGYVPSSLPHELIQKWKASTTQTQTQTQKTDSDSADADAVSKEIIEIIDDESRDSHNSDTFSKAEASNGSVHQIKFSDLGIPSHTSPACESALLASISAPRPPNNTIQTISDANLSPLQFEGVTLAIARHQRLFLVAGKWKRAGFFLGDAAGIGKGRQMASILRDSIFRGRPRHIWISVSRELSRDAKRDLDAVACFGVPVFEPNQVLSGSTSNGKAFSSNHNRGVLFLTYSLLIASKRMDQIIQWLTTGSTNGNGKETQSEALEHSYDGVIILDEAHKAKNLEADTLTAKLVIQLQERLPLARVVYGSATGVSDLHHMVYANRLGLWGSSLYPDFETFRKTLSNRGMGSLELLALELKQMGTFVARSLSWDGAEFHTIETQLSLHHRNMYDAAVSWWNTVQQELNNALKLVGSHVNPMIWRNYWSAHQRFFREMALCAKIEPVVEVAKKHLEEGCAIVIGLQSTGEASTQVAMEEMAQELGEGSASKIDFSDILLQSLVSTARSTLTNFIRNNFPVKPNPPTPPKVPELSENASKELKAYQAFCKSEAIRIKNMPPPDDIPDLLRSREALLAAAQQLLLPPNPLDDLIDRLGGEECVAELTGRSGRILRHKDGTHYHFVRRAEQSSNQKCLGLSMPKNPEDFDKLNIVEKKRFMDGRKHVAVISDAASTGISLHAALGTKNCHRRRVHLTIELPWAADKAIQQLGRSHRSGQISAPIYKMIVTELGGERRFGAAVAKRMANMGALTKGDRRAASGSDLSEFDIDSEYGRRAVARLYQSLDPETMSVVATPSRNAAGILEDYTRKNVPNSFSLNDTQLRRLAMGAAQQAIIDIGLLADGQKKKASVKLFLNRLAGIPVQKQKLVFSLFMSTMNDVVADAKATGQFEGSVEDVRATKIEMEGLPEKLAIDKRSGAETKLVRLILDRGISTEDIVSQCLSDGAFEENNSGVALSGFYLSKRVVAGRNLVLYAKRKVGLDLTTKVYVPDPCGLMIITRPNTGKNQCEMSTIDLRLKYRLISSAHDIRKLFKGNEAWSASTVSQATMEVITRHKPDIIREWKRAYSDSFSFESNRGLAPRCSRLGLVTGAVLHVLPALEQTVIMRSLTERSLRVARVEISQTGQRFVGVRFPVDEGAVSSLREALANKQVAVGGASTSSNLEFQDQNFTPIDSKLAKWATSEPKTMRSFFKVASVGSAKKRKADDNSVVISPPSAKKRTVTTAKPLTSSLKPMKSTRKKASASIRSFFMKK